MSDIPRDSLERRQFTELPPLSLYVHIPWCIRKCPYCDFNSHEHREGPVPEQAYVAALLADLEQEMPNIWGRQISSIFIGGGTPSLFSAESIDSLLCGIRALTAFNPECEVTMEANPGTFEQDKFADFRAAGINRLSIGIQSFSEESLQRLGRVHGADEARRAVAIARQAGFDNLNLDLMFGLPEQSRSEALADLETAIAFQPEHISYYQLTLEPNTLFAARPPTLPLDETIWSVQETAMELLAGNGYQRYEISAFAKAQKQSTHNTNYWLYGDYVGIGAGAHGKLSFANTGQILRRWKIKHPARYLEAASSDKRIGGDQIVPLDDTALEFMMNALRLTDGFPMPLFQQHTGTDLFQYQGIIEQAIDDGLLSTNGIQLAPTPKGSDFLNDLLERFMGLDAVKSYPVIRLQPAPKKH